MKLGEIWSLRPNVTRSEAIEALRGRGVGALLTRLRDGVLRCVAEVYVPFRVYRVEVAKGATTARRWFALDAVNGMLDPYEFPSLPEERHLARVESRNRLPATLGETLAKELLHEKILRVVFQQGFFRARTPRIKAELETVEVHVPYWLGFYGVDSSVRCGVVDAVRRRVEGDKARAFFEAWLAS